MMSQTEKPKTYKQSIWVKWTLVFKIMPLVVFVGIMKYLLHNYDLEVLDLNALFTTLVAGTIFLIGFLISGVLADYKESEKIPADISASLKSLFDDTYTVYKSKNSAHAFGFMEYQKKFSSSLINWFYRKERTHEILAKISAMNDFFVELDKEGIQPNYIIKMKNEQNSIRKFVLRADTIRDTGFVSSAYTIVEVMGLLIAGGLVAMKIEPFYAALFFTLLVTFLITYMFFLLKDLDNPFDYKANGERGTEVPLKPLHDLETELNSFQ